MVFGESTSGTELFCLSPKEGEALELVAQQFTNKEIARELKISSRAVEERLKSARSKLGAPDRRVAARRYAFLRSTCAESTGEPTTVEKPLAIPQTLVREATDPPRFVLEDVGFGSFPSEANRPSRLEAYDVKFGRLGRIYAVIGLAALIALLLVAGVTIAVVAQMLT